MTQPHTHSVVYAALARGFDAGRAAAVRAAEEPRADESGHGTRLTTPSEIATEAMIAMTEVLEAAKVLQEPQAPAPPAMTVADAAKLLCRLSRTVRLDEPEADHVQLLQVPTMVDYAWSHAVAEGIPPAEATEANEALRLLREHHAAQIQH